MKPKSKKGGARVGAGRPTKAPTKIITFRIKPEWETHIREIVNKEMELLKKAE